ncbi:MAG: PAS domain S-box protein [candidate division WOR-3 bacterium]|nr:PAS domain S-box protein [candidate division WOR-3 bacterium]
MQVGNESLPRPFPFVADITFQRGDVVFAADKRGRLVYWNKEAEQLFGYPADDVLGSPFEVICMAAPGGSGVDLPAILSGGDFAGGMRCSDKSGREVALYMYATAGRDQSGTAVGVVFVARDVTPFWSAEQAVRTAEDKHRLLFKHSSDSVVIADIDGRVREANPTCLRLYAYTADEVRQMNLAEMVAPEHRAEAAEALTNLAAGKSVTKTIKMLRKDGTQFVADLAASVVSVTGERRILWVTRDVTERVRAEQATKESERKYRLVFESASDAVFVEATDGRILDANRRACDLLGYAKEELLKLKVSDLVPADARVWLPHVTDAILREEKFRTEAINVHKSGRRIPVEMTASTIELDNIPVVLAIVRDISERKQAEQALRKEKELAQTYLEVAGVVMVVLDETGAIQLTNRKGCSVLGGVAADIVGRNWFDTFVPERLRADVKRVFDHLMRGEIEPLDHYENPVVTMRGEERLVAWHNVLLRDDAGRVIGTLSSGEDITERKSAEKRLQESEERFRRLVEMSPDGIAVHQGGKLVLVNPAGARVLGYDRPEDLVGKPVLDFVHPDDQPAVLARITQVLQLGRSGGLVEERFRRKNGSYVPVEVVNAPFYWLGKPAVQVVVRDISVRKELARMAEETADELRAVLDNSPGAIAAECEGTFVYANQRFVQMFGYEAREQVVGRAASAFDAPQDRERLAEYSRLRERGQDAPASYTFRGLKHDGTITSMEASISTYRSLGRLHILTFIREVEPGRDDH